MIRIVANPQAEKTIEKDGEKIGKLCPADFSGLPGWTKRYETAQRLWLMGEDSTCRETGFTILTMTGEQEFCVLHNGELAADRGDTNLESVVGYAISNIGNF